MATYNVKQNQEQWRIWSVELDPSPNGVYNIIGKKNNYTKDNTRKHQVTKFLKFQYRDSDARKLLREKIAKKGLKEDTGSELGFEEFTSLK